MPRTFVCTCIPQGHRVVVLTLPLRHNRVLVFSFARVRMPGGHGRLSVFTESEV
jgi:hypothetical protein